jgi:hypothetical protein
MLRPQGATSRRVWGTPEGSGTPGRFGGTPEVEGRCLGCPVSLALLAFFVCSAPGVPLLQVPVRIIGFKD